MSILQVADQAAIAQWQTCLQMPFREGSCPVRSRGFDLIIASCRQIAVVHGISVAGGAYMPAMADGQSEGWT